MIFFLGIINKLKKKEMKSPKGKDVWSKKEMEFVVILKWGEMESCADRVKDIVR